MEQNPKTSRCFLNSFTTVYIKKKVLNCKFPIKVKRKSVTDIKMYNL